MDDYASRMPSGDSNVVVVKKKPRRGRFDTDGKKALKVILISGDFAQEQTLMEITANGVTKTPRRYAEGTASVGFGAEVGYDEQADNDLSQNVEGDLDVDVAELSLGQRLTALSGGKPTTSSEDEDSDGGQKAPIPGRDAKAKAEPLVPANSLTRTLIQALHSSDAKLTETCLSHSDPILINNTIDDPIFVDAKLDCSTLRPPCDLDKAACTTRKPSIIKRATGHGIDTNRNAFIGCSYTSWYPTEKKVTKQRARKARQYVEGESEEEVVQMDAVVEADSGDEGGSIEDVELGGGSDDDEEEETSEEEEEEDDGSDDDDEEEEGPTLNGFIGDEAEDDDEDDESD
ncbi:Small (SSU) processome component [Salix suchowensis]|nr:Small (SSU) processome component [Salix suchowensis]